MFRMDQKQESYFKKAVDLVTKFFFWFLFLASCACLKGVSNSINFLKGVFQNINSISYTINIFDFVR